MSDELRAATERLRTHGYRRNKDYDSFWEPIQRQADLQAVTDAYLAANPADDGEPVTHEWACSINPNGSNLFEFGDGCSVWLNFNAQGGYMQIEDGTNDGADLALPTTRGAFRKLCEALGVPHKEAT